MLPVQMTLRLQVLPRTRPLITALLGRRLNSDSRPLGQAIRRYVSEKESNRQPHVPKGFENFFGKNKAWQQKGASETHNANSSKPNNSPKPPPLSDPRNNMTTMLPALFGTWLVWRMIAPQENAREITWQDFRNAFLDKGLVDRLDVINRNRVRVHLQPEAQSIQNVSLYHVLL
jgi:AFG3 family protein